MSSPSYLRPVQVNLLLARIRLMIGLFMLGLIVSGLTAFPLVRSTGWLLTLLHSAQVNPASQFVQWVERVHAAIVVSQQTAPFLAYGTDWLAFAHLVIALAFIGPFLDPVRNRWVIDFGLIACAGVLPLALIAGPIRQVPFFWRVIDCSFGVAGAVPLLLCRHYLALLQRAERSARQRSDARPVVRRRRHRTLGTGR